MLSLAGVKGNRDGFERFCSDPAQAISHCADILRSGIKISDIDKAKWESEWKDPRIISVAAIDPALTWGLTRDDVAGLKTPLLLIGLGSETDRLHATDTSAIGSGFDALVPAAAITRIAPATHFTALGQCKPNGAEILKGEHDDPVCTDSAGADRAIVMARIIEAMASHFGLPSVPTHPIRSIPRPAGPSVPPIAPLERLVPAGPASRPSQSPTATFAKQE